MAERDHMHELEALTSAARDLDSEVAGDFIGHALACAELDHQDMDDISPERFLHRAMLEVAFAAAWVIWAAQEGFEVNDRVLPMAAELFGLMAETDERVWDTKGSEG